LEKPSAARRIIFARTTRKYGNVYLAALDVSSRASARVREISYGLLLGIPVLLHERGYGRKRQKINGKIRYCIYENTH
jgi:hypothetical protein